MRYKCSLVLVGLLLLFTCHSVFSQSLVRGRVIDDSTHEPLEMVAVRYNQTTQTALTDADGNFVLKNISLPARLEVSMIGYKTQKLLVNDRDKPTALTITLEKGIFDLKEVIITNQTGSTIGAFHTLSRIDLNIRPVRSAQDLLRLVPGLFIAQHQGGGKAEQMFLRGFDADHGTDVNVSVDGIPVNMVTHAHGQGYADLHFLIPETVNSYDFGKGPYYTDKGDFNTAGYVAYNTKTVPDQDMVRVELGHGFGIVSHVAGSIKIAFIGVIWPFAKIVAVNRFRDQKVQVGVALAVRMGNHINGDTINRYIDIGAVIGIKTT